MGGTVKRLIDFEPVAPYEPQILADFKPVAPYEPPGLISRLAGRVLNAAEATPGLIGDQVGWVSPENDFWKMIPGGLWDAANTAPAGLREPIAPITPEAPPVAPVAPANPALTAALTAVPGPPVSTQEFPPVSPGVFTPEGEPTFKATLEDLATTAYTPAFAWWDLAHKVSGLIPEPPPPIPPNRPDLEVTELADLLSLSKTGMTVARGLMGLWAWLVNTPAGLATTGVESLNRNLDAGDSTAKALAGAAVNTALLGLGLKLPIGRVVTAPLSNPIARIAANSLASGALLGGTNVATGEAERLFHPETEADPMAALLQGGLLGGFLGALHGAKTKTIPKTEFAGGEVRTATPNPPYSTGPGEVPARLPGPSTMPQETPAPLETPLPPEPQIVEPRPTALAERPVTPLEPVSPETQPVIQPEERANIANIANVAPVEPISAGKATAISAAGMKPIPARYALMDLDQVQASHSARSGAIQPNPEYPKGETVETGLQPRSYAPGSQEEAGVFEHAAAKEPRYWLSDTASPADGAPVVTPDGTVVNGNGRVMTLQVAAGRNDYGWYRDALKERAGQFGIDPAQVDQARAPVLVRVVDMNPASPEARRFAEAGNRTTTTMQSPARVAAGLTRLVDTRLLDTLDLEQKSFGDAVNDPSAGREFRDGLRTAVGRENAPLYFTPEGQLTAGGKELAQNALLSQVLDVDTLERLGADRKQVRRSLESAIIPILKIRRDFPQSDFSPALAEAVRFVARNPEIRTSAEARNVLGQGDVFTGKSEQSVSPGALMFVDSILQDGNKPAVFRQRIQAFANALQDRSGLFAAEARDPVTAAAEELHIAAQAGAEFAPAIRQPGAPGRLEITPEQPGMDMASRVAQQPGSEFTSGRGLGRLQIAPETDKAIRAALPAQPAAASEPSRGYQSAPPELVTAATIRAEAQLRGESLADKLKVNLAGIKSKAEGDARIAAAIDAEVARRNAPQAPGESRENLQTPLDKTKEPGYNLTDKEVAYESAKAVREIVKTYASEAREPESARGGTYGGNNRTGGAVRRIISSVRDFATRGYIDIKGHNAALPEDVAALAQIWRDPRFETGRFVYCKNGICVRHEAVTSRVAGLTRVPGQPLTIRQVSEIRARAQSLGADSIYWIHNHPGGDVACTPDDLDMHVILRDLLASPNAQLPPPVRVLGGIIIDHGEFGFIDPQGNFSKRPLPVDTPEDPLRHFDQGPLGLLIKSSDDIAVAAKHIVTDGIPVVITSGPGHVVMGTELMPGDLRPTALPQTGNMLRNLARQVGGHRIFVSYEDGSISSQSQRGLEYLHNIGDLADIVTRSGTDIRSRHEQLGRAPEDVNRLWRKERAEPPEYAVHENVEDYLRQVRDQGHSQDMTDPDIRKELVDRFGAAVGDHFDRVASAGPPPGQAPLPGAEGPPPPPEPPVQPNLPPSGEPPTPEERVQQYYDMVARGQEPASPQPALRRIGDMIRTAYQTAERMLWEERGPLKRAIKPGTPPELDPYLWTQEVAYSDCRNEIAHRDLDAHVLGPLLKGTGTVDDLGVYMGLRRSATERAGIESPVAAGEAATETLDALRSRLGDEKFQAVQAAADSYWRWRQTYVFPMLRESEFPLLTDELQQHIENNEMYATFQIQEQLNSRYGIAVGAAIHQQYGTTKAIKNPFISSVVKDFSLMQAAVRNDGKAFLCTNADADLITDAQTRWVNDHNEFLDPPDRDQALMVYMDHGKPVGKYVPRQVQDFYERNPVEAHIAARAIHGAGIPWRAILTEYNPAFPLWNLPRDVQANLKQLPRAGPVRLAYHYARTLPDAILDGGFDKMTPLTRNMYLRRMLLVDRAWRSREQSSADSEVEQRLNDFADNPTQIEPFYRHLNPARFVSRMNKVVERWSKIAGFSYLESGVKSGRLDLTPMEIAECVRSDAGSPDFKAHGKFTMVVNSLLMFENPAMQGFRAALRAARRNPSDYLLKTTLFNVIPALAVSAGIHGLLGSWVQRVSQKIPSHDADNRYCIPIAETIGGKAVYLLMPMDYIGQFVFSCVRATFEQDTTRAMASAVEGINPLSTSQLTPPIKLLADIATYLRTGNVYDAFRGRFAIPETTQAAADLPAAVKAKLAAPTEPLDARTEAKTHAVKDFLKYELNNSFGQYYRFNASDTAAAQTEFEQTLDIPVLGNILKRFVRLSNQGDEKRYREIMDKVTREHAAGIEACRDIIRKHIRLNGADATTGTGWVDAYHAAKNAGALDPTYSATDFRNRYVDAAKLTPGLTPPEVRVQVHATKAERRALQESLK